MQIQVENLTRIRVIEPKTIINSNDNLQNFPNKPLGLVFWQGWCWNEATTLPRCAAKGNPLGLVFLNIRGLAYYQWIISRFVDSSEMLTFAYARARSALGSIIHQLNLYQQ